MSDDISNLCRSSNSPLGEIQRPRTSALLIYPEEFESILNLTVDEVLQLWKRTIRTGATDSVNINGEIVSPSKATRYAYKKNYVKYWITTTEVIKLTNNFYWNLTQLKRDELLIVVANNLQHFSANIIIDRYVLSLE